MPDEAWRIWERYWQIDAVGWEMVRDTLAPMTADEQDWMLDALQQIEYAVRRRQMIDAKQKPT